MGFFDALTGKAAKKAAAEQERAILEQQAITDRQLNIADEQWNQYLNTFVPLETSLIDQALARGSMSGQQQAASEAAGAVSQGYDNLRERLRTTPGLNRTSEKYDNTLKRLDLTEAAQSAAAQTGARRDAVAQGDTMLADAVGLGKGLAGNATAQLGSAANMAAGASASAAKQVAAANQQQGNLFSAIGSLAQGPVGTGISNFVGGLFRQPDIGNLAGTSVMTDLSGALQPII